MNTTATNSKSTKNDKNQIKQNKSSVVTKPPI